MTVPLPARLLRGFANDFLTGHDNHVVERIMDPAYCLSISGHRLAGRDDVYLPATAAQLDLFPGLVVTAHDTVFSSDAMALRFTEHGVSARDGRAAAWGGITLFRIGNGRIVHGWAEEDYLARKRQQKSGQVDPVAPPHPAPWDEPVRDADEATEQAVHSWLEALDFGCVEDVAAEGPRIVDLIVPRAVTLSTLFSAGPRAAFHAVVTGDYRGGLDDGAASGAPIALSIAAIADVAHGRVERIQICADRLGLQRLLGTR
ncbi:ester cyclase [Sphingomonas sp. 1P06PA]|uniref:ester cyclase n=1 Tax=Sphingomonas sp. 1P06PA TaxID=554121 RepID=UPI0039A773BD